MLGLSHTMKGQALVETEMVALRSAILWQLKYSEYCCHAGGDDPFV